MTIRVFLVDDHALVRTGMRMILASEVDIEVVGEAESGEDEVPARPAPSKPRKEKAVRREREEVEEALPDVDDDEPLMAEEEDEDDEATNAEMDRVRRYVPKGHLFADEEDEEDEHTRMFDDEEEESDDDEEPRRGRYADDDEESEDDVMAERIIHWAPPITAVVCALIIAVSLIYHFVIA